MGSIVERFVTEPVQGFLERVIEFLPNLLSAVLILILGLIIAQAVRFILGKVFRMLNIDEIAGRSGVTKLMERGGIKGLFSSILSRFVDWIIVFGFVVIALSSLNVPAIEGLIEKFFLYLPNVFVALIILVFGTMLSNFLGQAALIASVNAGLRMAGLVGKAAKFTVFLFTLSIALEQLGIGKETVVIAFAIVFGGVVLALAIAFGLGGKEIATEYLAKKIRGEGEEKKDEIGHL